MRHAEERASHGTTNFSEYSGGVTTISRTKMQEKLNIDKNLKILQSL